MDAVRVRRNAERIGEKAKLNGVRLRPHIKTHKCVEVAQHSHYNVIENNEIVDRWEIHGGW